MSPNRIPIPILAGALVLAVFAIDLLHPAGFAAPLLYLPAVLVTVLASRWRVVLGIAFAASALTIVAYPLSPAAGHEPSGLWNRLLVIAVIAMATPLILVQIRARESMRRLSIRDQLTGAYNRRQLAAAAARRIAAWHRYGHPVTLALVDIDHFKRINDSHGHDVGDRVLRETSELLVATMRELDVVARIGGEEFAILMPGVGLDSGCRAAERMRQAIEGHVFRPEGSRVSVRISVGVATLSPGAPTLIALMRAADEMLYRAKRMGRNRVQPSADPPAVERKPEVERIMA